ncbi:hypothetical protein ABMA67_02430 [Halobacteriovorax sp. RZ-3]|uniref:hypothetical protein n=1 Tax=Halobacteriovorax sp. RZ-3 TaxID=3157720 RepID=UPI0037113936
MIIETEEHPDWYHHVEGMRCLILGTYPPSAKRRNYPFYYPNKSNRFWETLAKVADHQLVFTENEDAVVERIGLMEQLKVGVENLGHVIERIDGSAEDKKITIKEYRDILSIIKKSPKLRTILLTGYSSNTNTYDDFLRYLAQNGIHIERLKKPKAKDSFYITVESREIKVIVGNSTSRAALSVKDESLVEQFKLAIFNE